MTQKTYSKPTAVSGKNIDTGTVLAYADGAWSGDDPHELASARRLDETRPLLRIGHEPVDLDDDDLDETVRAGAIILEAMRGRGVLTEGPDNPPWAVADPEPEIVYETDQEA